MRTTASFQFYCRNSKANKQGLAPMELSICICGERKFINLPMKFRPDDFNRKRKPQEIAAAINLWHTKINTYIMDLMKDGQPLTTDTLREVIQTGGVKAYTIERMFNDYLTIVKGRIGIDITEATYRKYELVRDKVYQHINKDSQVTALTPMVVKKIQNHWNSIYDLSSTAGFLTKFKSVVRFAMDNGHLKINPFQQIKISKPRKPINALTEEEIMKIVNTHISDKRLHKIKDLFLIQCGTGMAFADLMKFDMEKDLQVEGTNYYICKERQKTGHTFTAMIMPFALPIILHYYELPRISNQKYNKYLKEIQTMCGIEKKITSHLGRKSYATLLVNKGVSMDVVGAALGDNPAIAAQYYAKVFDSTIIQAQAAAFSA